MRVRRSRLSYRKNGRHPYYKKRALGRLQARMLKGEKSMSMSNSSTNNATSSWQPFLGFDVPPAKPALRVLSLFDGISTALHCLDTMKLHVEVYYSSEIDKKALQLQRHRFQERVVRLASVTDVNEDVLASLGRIDLLVGGSPCSEISLVNPRRKGLRDPTSVSHLFYDYVRIRDSLSAKAAEDGRKFWWLFENTFHMEIATKEEMSRALGCSPVVKDACQYLPVHRKRYFWSNLNTLSESVSIPGPPIKLNDFLPLSRSANVEIIPTITSSSASQKTGKEKQHPVIEDGQECKLYITELEKLFGLPESYTDGPNLSITDRRVLLGKAFVVPIIQELLSPLKDLFWTRPAHLSYK